MKKRMLKKELGVTLVALIVTVIVLLILVGIVLSLVIGQGGIINIAQQAGQNHLKAQEQEKNELEKLYSSMMIATNDSSQITISMQDLKTLIQEEIKKSGSTTAPIGNIISQMGNEAPAGYLVCDGTVYNISEYQTLADYINTQFGSYNYFGGDGTTTFAVPDLRGEFLRGTGVATRNTGEGAAVGIHQDPTKHIDIIVYSDGTKNRILTGNKNVTNANQNKDFTYNISSKGRAGFDASNTDTSTHSPNSHYSSRPTNTSVLYCIKY